MLVTLHLTVRVLVTPHLVLLLSYLTGHPMNEEDGRLWVSCKKREHNPSVLFRMVQGFYMTNGALSNLRSSELWYDCIMKVYALVGATSIADAQ